MAYSAAPFAEEPTQMVYFMTALGSSEQAEGLLVPEMALGALLFLHCGIDKR